MKLPTRIDGLPALPLPVAGSDRMFLSRGGLLRRQDLSGMHGGLFARKTIMTPAAADFGTWVNQGDATLTHNGDVLSLEHPGTIVGGNNLKCRERPLPSGAWDVTIGCRRVWAARATFTGGILLRESSSNRIETFGFAYDWMGLLQQRFLSPTALDGARRRSSEYMEFAWFRLRRCGKQFIPLFSADGATWAQFDAAVPFDTLFVTEPDRWGFFIQPVNGSTPAASQRLDVFDWAEGSDTELEPHFSSYRNADGQGARTNRIAVTTNAALGGARPIQNLVDGEFLNGLSPWWQSGQSGRHITFRFAEHKVITEVIWYQNATTPHGTWKWQGSLDGVAWSDISAGFTLDGGASGAIIGDLSANATPYPGYRMLQTAGETSDNPFLLEIEFKIRHDS